MFPTERPNKKRVTCPQKGYYSEKISPRVTKRLFPGVYSVLEDREIDKQESIYYLCKKDGNVPLMPRLLPPIRDKFLSPTRKWITFDEHKQIAFPIKSFKPKVQMQYKVPPKTLPRRVEIERLRRRYNEQDIHLLLEQVGVKPSLLIPPDEIKTLVKEDQKFGVNQSFNFLPLEIFDNEEYDCRTPEEWMAMGKVKGVQHPVPALAFVRKRPSLHCEALDTIFDWTNAAVTDYNPQNKLYSVLTLDSSDEICHLPRVYIMFRAEDPEVFAERLRDAVSRRNEAETVIKFRAYVDCLIFTGLPTMPESTWENILQMGTRKGALKGLEHEIEELQKHISYLYTRAMAEISFRACVDGFPEVFYFVKLPPTTKEVVPEYGRMKSKMADFAETSCNLRWLSLYVIQETYYAMCRVVEECRKAAAMNMFTLSYGKFVALEEFESAQLKVTQNTIKFLRSMWLENITQHLLMYLRDVGKGWFNIFETKWDIYEISKLNRLMNLVKFRMQGALRTLVDNSVNLLVNLLETPCLCTLHVDEEFVWGDDLITTQFAPSSTPVFLIGLKMNEELVFFSNNLEQFEKTILNLFRNAVVLTHTIQQVHPYLLTNLKFAEDLLLSSVGLKDPYIDDLHQRLETAYQKCIIPMQAYAKEYYRHIELWKTNINEYVQAFSDANHSAVEYKEEAQFQFKMEANLMATVPDKIIIGPFVLNVDPLKQFLMNKRHEMGMKLLDNFAIKMRAQVEELLDEYKNLMRKLNDKPTSIENLLDIKDWMETVPMTVIGLTETMKRLALEYEILDAFWYPLEEEDFEAKWEGISWPMKIRGQVDGTTQFFELEIERFQKIQVYDEAALNERVDGLTMQITQMSTQVDISKVHELGNECRRIWKNMKECQEQGQQLNSRQKLFGMPVVPFENLNRLIKEFDPYRNLWSTASDFLKYYEIWMDNPLVNVDGESIDRMVTEFYKTIVKSVRVFTDIPGIQRVAIEVKEKIEAFRPNVALIQALRNPGMRQRHWDELAQRTGVVLTWGPTLTYNNCLDAGIGDYAEVLGGIAEAAGKEFAIESTLTKMTTEWEAVELEINPYKTSGTYIMKLSEDVAQMLDDHIALTQQISFSPFKAAFEDQINDWEQKLHLTQDVLDEWSECQKQWMYLEPIFTSEDINRQLPVESKKYSTMERNWRRLMKGAFELPKVMELCPDPRLLESFKECRALLNIVEKGLADYLETKRIIFPRFYFLSDDELLEILSQAKNPLAVQPHLRKCFENIAKLHFDEDLLITQMYSAEGEQVALRPSMYPAGNVENWLLKVEDTMRNTVRETLGSSIADLETTERKKWVLMWPGQIVIAGSQTAWTSSVEIAILGKSLRTYLMTMLQQLNDLRSLVKGPLQRIERQVLSALIVIEVHARDVLSDLVDEAVTNVNDFEWIKQLRYYWVEEAEKVRAVNAEFSYGYEYLGNSGRLVITPLTDRCYLTLTGALHLKFGGAPAGPAGTGKTETTKDLAKAFAIQCVVFNCSDQLDFMAMGKFFKGLASSGAWACFDEFNRIDIEVLSVVAQQITTIQKAQQARLERFMFEGAEIALKQSCAVFITMNPGYAGRTELPDNLKALFRPVAMMVPNYTLIAEISLFSFGFSDAKELAGKITTTFKLSSEQLSTQDHYDFGMRAVKTVIAVAGNLKREHPDMDERQIVLRSLRDVNVPKFLKDDLKLFNGIVSDLFPRMVEEAVDYGELETAIRSSCLKNNLEDVTGFVHKVIQLYETTVVRHGLMLVGPAGSGKTKCYEVLQAAMTSLQGTQSPGGMPFEVVHTYVLNPKSITMGQLYGEFDMLTHEWTDGILSSLVRQGASATDEDKRWYVFDGPVDAVWIENMNTVLDDNKKLCLTSGEIMKLRDPMTMMFEVGDLAVASPATVSRCGMVYLEPGVLGLEPFVTCWLRQLPPLATALVPSLQKLLNRYLLPGLDLLRASLKEVVTSVDAGVTMSFLRLLRSRMTPLQNPSGKPPPAAQFLALMPNLLVPWVVFSLVWTVGATCDVPSRQKFSDWLRNVMKEAGDGPEFPSGMVYDYKLNDGGFTDPTSDGDPAPPCWVHWMEGAPEVAIGPDTKFSDMEIPTIDTIRNAALLGTMVEETHPVLVVGPTGSCKTVTVSAKLSRGLHKNFICDFIVFSARTSANQTQDLIDSKLDKRRKGVFGPPPMKKQVFFIDDLNMPSLEVFGAQPPIELIRQWMDFGGWYDRKNIGEFRSIVDVIFVGAMGPPGGGRNPVTARLLRHFYFIAFNDLEDASKVRIFGTILESWLSRVTDMQNLQDALVTATLQVYSTILLELLPTPAKTHYTFNLRDLSKVFQGVLMVDPESIKELKQLVRLWHHECCRVFQDRLVNDHDREWFDALLRKHIVQDLGGDPDDLLGQDTILFGDFLDVTSDVRVYNEIHDMDRLSNVLDDYLADFNTTSQKPMRLVLFLDAMCHVCRISRIIRQPMGNALLLGMSGSGRQSLTRLSTHIMEMTCFQIELSKTYGATEWRDDVKKLMLNAGILAIDTVFLFSDSQIKSESFLEDLNNVLNSGDVPNIYQVDELDKIYQAMRGVVQELGLSLTKSNLFTAYQRAVRSRLHSVITMSPIGEVFRARLRMFPALVNCCTIDWFSPWPDSALQSVALQFLNETPELEVTPEVLNGIVVTCQYMHQSVVDASTLYLQELNRHNYVTPTSYLELLASYSALLGKKKGELSQRMQRLKVGLAKLLTTSEEVKVLQQELEVMKPALTAAANDAAAMLERIAKDQVTAEETKQVVEKEEAEAASIKEITQAIADDAQRDLDEAMPELLAAEASLKDLNKNDITEVRALKSPPKGVHMVIETICIVKDIKPNRLPGKMPGEKILDYWEPGRGMLQNPDHFLQSLVNFDKDSITEAIVAKLKPFIDDPNFQAKKIVKVSKACTSLCLWVHAMYKYYFVNKSVAPKKAALAEAQQRLAATERALAEAKMRMQEVADGLAVLQRDLDTTERQKQVLEDKQKLCEDRMGRAVRLVTGLADERVRWMDTVAALGIAIGKLVGDVLVSAGAVAYITPFTDKYRRVLMDEWVEMVDAQGVPHTPNSTPVSTLGDAMLIRQWQLDGLPRDALSTESAVLVYHSKRWPLFVDPQGQAVRWIKNMGRGSGIAIAKLSDKDLLRTLESCVRFGKPCLIENIATELDPALDPLLMRQVFRQGGTTVIKLGESVVPYSDDFRLFMTTRLANPHYTPEVSIKVLMVNFTLVPSGLQDQLLALVVMQERLDLEEARSAIIVSSAQMKNELQDIEDRILQRLSASEGNPVDDIDLIVTLEASKVKSEEIKLKVLAAEKTQVDIDLTRAQYIPVANRGQILFFCLSDLSSIDPMYQYSLEWFIQIFVASLLNTEKSGSIKTRIENINNYFTFSLYSNVCRSLFEKHKLHFAFLVCVRIMMDDESISRHEYHVLLAGGVPPQENPNPAPEWLSIRAWKDIQSLAVLDNFKPWVESFVDNLAFYKKIFDSTEPHEEQLPKPWNEKYSVFQRLLILKCLRPDKLRNGMQDFLRLNLGARFIEPQTTDLADIYKDSSATTPLIFVLSTGTDPAADLYKFADKMKFSKRFSVISLGQGQGPRAEAMLRHSIQDGFWVFFQNCHLAPSWMPSLEQLIEEITPDTTHKDFRVWLTSTPSPHFPVSILQNGSKMTVEPPRGVKANLLRAYTSQVSDLQEFLNSTSEKVPTFKYLLFSLCLFHAVCLERRKFGPLGFNIPYEFTDGDLRICISQLHMFLVEYDVIPFKVLTYTAGHINYGGRVTDDWDRRCIMNMLSDYYDTKVVTSEHVFDDDGVYHQQEPDANIDAYIAYVRTLPLNDQPGLFGLHSNADISYAQSETYSCLATLLELQPRTIGSSSMSQEEVTTQAANNINGSTPKLFDLESIMKKYPVLYEESLNTVLVQEVIRYNRLLDVIHSSLNELLRALKGLVVMSEALEAMSYSLFTNTVPGIWANKAYPSLKPLGSWVNDLQDRVNFLQKWIKKGIPPVFWISGFFFPQAFLTGTLQNYARKHTVAIDSINFAFQVLRQAPTRRPADGSCIYGLFLEGARWHDDRYTLTESRMKELYTDMPVVLMIPEKNHKIAEKGIYECPVYKTLTRAGTLSTTGHSTNYVVAMEVPSDRSQSHWIKRGVALFCALDF